MEKILINKCTCGSNDINMRSFKTDFYGYVMICNNCKKECYAQAIPLINTEHRNISKLTWLQNSLATKWNSENLPKEQTENIENKA